MMASVGSYPGWSSTIIMSPFSHKAVLAMWSSDFQKRKIYGVSSFVKPFTCVIWCTSCKGFSFMLSFLFLFAAQHKSRATQPPGGISQVTFGWTPWITIVLLKTQNHWGPSGLGSHTFLSICLLLVDIVLCSVVIFFFVIVYSIQ